ncbi:DUF1311 domain-containing protein, partial [Azospirillum sp. INR13]|nr:DUF1311 domain-containing protein [Azospirillum sp. INR13]
MRIFAYMVIAFAFILPSASFSQTNSPSYNCSLVTQDVEVFVCNDSFLASMDRDLSQIYRSYIASLPYDQAELLRKGEAAWVRDRNNRCKIGERLVDRSCIEAAYRGRITALNSLASLSFVPGEWASEGMKWVQLASRSSADEAKAIAASLRYKVPQHGPYLVLLTLNGW